VVISPTFTSAFDTNFGANAAAARAAWNAAADVLVGNLSDDITLNITVDAVTDITVFSSSAMPLQSISYTDLLAKVNAGAKTQDDLTAVGTGGSMTAADPTGGDGTWWLTRSQAKAFGLVDADDPSNDGSTTFGTGNAWTFSGEIAEHTFDFQGAAAHEISEVMGRLGLSGGNVGMTANSFSLIDNFSYTSPGAKGIHGGTGNNFSIDDGTTLVKLFNDPTANGLDSRDWAPGTNDAFNQFSDAGVVNPFSAVDLRVMDVIGYDAHDPLGSVHEVVGRITFLRAHDLGTGYGKPPNFLDCEVIVLLAEEPDHAFGFKLRADSEEPTRTEMFDLLRSAFVAERPVRLDYLKTGPQVGEIIRVANP
jgi:hypothetical protein